MVEHQDSRAGMGFFGRQQQDPLYQIGGLWGAGLEAPPMRIEVEIRLQPQFCACKRTEWECMFKFRLFNYTNFYSQLKSHHIAHNALWLCYCVLYIICETECKDQSDSREVQSSRGCICRQCSDHRQCDSMNHHCDNDTAGCTRHQTIRYDMVLTTAIHIPAHRGLHAKILYFNCWNT